MPGVRKRTFDDQDALRTAMELFWCQGYEGTSIADLTQALGINPPSLYAAFGSKRDLFERTLNRYMCERTIQLEEAMTRPTADEAVLELLTGRVEVFTSPCQPAGCMTIQAGLSADDPHQEIVDLLAAAREEMRRSVLGRFDKALADGDLPPDTDCSALARYVMSAIYGLSVEAASGAPRQELMAAAVLAAGVVPKA